MDSNCLRIGFLFYVRVRMKAPKTIAHIYHTKILTSPAQRVCFFFRLLVWFRSMNLHNEPFVTHSHYTHYRFCVFSTSTQTHNFCMSMCVCSFFSFGIKWIQDDFRNPLIHIKELEVCENQIDRIHKQTTEISNPILSKHDFSTAQIVYLLHYLGPTYILK